MKLVAESADGKATQLGLSTKGEEWLAGPLEDQYASLFDLLRARVARDAVYKPELWFFYKDVFDPYGYSDRGPSDFRFLGDNVAVMKKGGDVELLRRGEARGRRGAPRVALPRLLRAQDRARSTRPRAWSITSPSAIRTRSCSASSRRR